MAFTYEFEPRAKYMLVRTRGVQATLEEGVAYARDIVNQGLANRLRRVLLDERELSVQTSTIEDFELVVRVVREGWHLDVHRIACVPRSEDLNKVKFFEDVAQNRNLNFRIFESVEDATRWLEND